MSAIEIEEVREFVDRRAGHASHVNWSLENDLRIIAFFISDDLFLETYDVQDLKRFIDACKKAGDFGEVFDRIFYDEDFFFSTP